MGISMEQQRKQGTPRGLLHSELTDRILGAFYAVHTALGGGFLESVYREALSRELTWRGLASSAHVGCAVHYRGEVVGQFCADIIVERRVVLELKAARAIDPTHVAQLLNYLRATELQVGLLLNFGKHAEFQRLVVDRSHRQATATTP
ncbi:MAG: GxxExxY protein [Phycisphaerales bacterium]